MEKMILYKKIKDEMKEEIYEGKINLLSERIIIHRYGVSNLTARRVLNELEEEGLLERKVGKGSIVIKPEEKEIKELGLILFDVIDPKEHSVADILKSIEKEAKGKGYQLHLYTTREREISDGMNSIRYLIEKRKIDGLFIISPINQKDVKFIKDQRMPVVVLNGEYVNIDVNTVNFNHKETVKKVSENLYKMGYSKIGLITGTKGEAGIKRAADLGMEGYNEFIKSRKIKYKLIRTLQHSEEEGYKVMEEIWELKEKPDALIVLSPLIYKGIKKFLEEKKEELYIIPYLEEKKEKKDHIYLPYEKIGKEGFLIMEQEIKGAKKIRKVEIPLEINISKEKRI